MTSSRNISQKITGQQKETASLRYSQTLKRKANHRDCKRRAEGQFSYKVVHNLSFLNANGAEHVKLRSFWRVLSRRLIQQSKYKGAFNSDRETKRKKQSKSRMK